MSERTRTVFFLFAIAAAVFAAGTTRVWDTDFWWHLESGERIASTHSIPRTDVLSYTARGREYVDHEWLFQLTQFAAFSAGGLAGVAILKCIVVAATFAVVFLMCVRRGASQWTAFAFVLLGLAGAMPRVIERPEIFSVLFLVLTVSLLERGAPLALLPLVTLVWANMHAAVILGLVVQLLFMLALAIERKSLARNAVAFAASLAAACLNPSGFRVLTVPFELTGIIESGVFTNREWMRPTLQSAPVFWIVLALSAAALLTTTRRAFTILLFLFAAYLSLRYVRNVGLFCTLAPLFMVAAERRVVRAIAVAAAPLFLLAMTVFYPFERGIGAPSHIPVRLADTIQRDGLRGNMFNTDRFGGYLAWRFSPQRPVFIDGRNEVYLPLMKRLAVAETDSREWVRLLRDFNIEYAVIAYNDRPNTVTTVQPNGSRSTSYAPWSAVRFPREQWALLDWDDAGMLLVRRDGVNAVRDEYRAVSPEVPGYLRALVDSGRVPRDAAIAELGRKLSEDPGSRRARELLDSLR